MKVKHNHIVSKLMKVVLFLFMASFFISFYPSELDRKIDKQIRKVFDLEQFEKIHIDNKDLFLRSNTEVFEINNNDLLVGYFTVTLAAGCKEGGCSIQGQQDEFEFFYMLTLFDTNAKIMKVRILDYESEYGYEIMAPGWLRQFEKNKKDFLEYNKDIDGISGATKSANSVVNEVNVVSAFMRELVSEESSQLK